MGGFWAEEEERRLIHLPTQLCDKVKGLSQWVLTPFRMQAQEPPSIASRGVVPCLHDGTLLSAESFFPEEKCTVLVVCLSTMSENSCADDVGASYTAHDDAHCAFMTFPLYTRTVNFGMKLVVFVSLSWRVRILSFL